LISKQLPHFIENALDSIKNNPLHNRLFQGGSWIIVGKVGTVLFGLISSILLTRILSPHDVGIYDVALSVISVAIIIAELGLGRTTIRLIGEARGNDQTVEIKEIIWGTLILTSLGIIITGGGYLLLGNAVIKHISNGDRLAALSILVIVIIAVASFSDILADIFKGLLTFRWAEANGWRGVLSAVFLSIGLLILRVLKVEASISDVLSITAFSIGIGCLFGLWKLRRLLQQIPQKIKSLPIKRLISISWPILFVQLITVISAQSIIWILGSFETSSDIAIYGRVFKTAALISTPTLFYRKVLAPFISELYVKQQTQSIQKIVRTIANLFFTGVVLISLVMMVWSSEILGVLYGEFYQSGANALRLLLLGELFNVATGACAQLLIMTGNEKELFFINSFIGIVSIATTFFLVMYFGMIGAVISRIFYLIGVNFFASWYTYKKTGIRSWIGRV